MNDAIVSEPPTEVEYHGHQDAEGNGGRERETW